MHHAGQDWEPVVHSYRVIPCKGTHQRLFSTMSGKKSRNPMSCFLTSLINSNFCIFSHLINYAWPKSGWNQQISKNRLHSLCRRCAWHCDDKFFVGNAFSYLETFRPARQNRRFLNNAIETGRAELHQVMPFKPPQIPKARLFSMHNIKNIALEQLQFTKSQRPKAALDERARWTLDISLTSLYSTHIQIPCGGTFAVFWEFTSVQIKVTVSTRRFYDKIENFVFSLFWGGLYLKWEN